ncbi:phosphoribosylformylglycinamidine synthase subunit PurS [Planctomonas deserti]|jgi:phosphoribosylformylglycinamidine synthase PurS subunit|uniref:phosphoribosylformylglycinamidine synthase subunit PurS n=1 Tax=Planctomonas deserti TaxID=2144185 RepID=UPI000D37ACB5|nr:phosphoribosylformylglycinamidine synthase subunit PurS [Planctomonas deserti]
MPTIVVEVMPKAELLDPQGKAVAGALARLGESRFTGVRIGKRFELVTDGPVDDALLSDVQKLAEDMLSNSVIEDVISVHVDGGDGSAVGSSSGDSSSGDAPAGELTGQAEASTQTGAR